MFISGRWPGRNRRQHAGETETFLRLNFVDSHKGIKFIQVVKLDTRMNPFPLYKSYIINVKSKILELEMCVLNLLLFKQKNVKTTNL